MSLAVHGVGLHHLAPLSVATLAFLPWVTLEEPLAFGPFRLVPFERALATGLVPKELHPAVTAIMEGYGHKRPVDREHVALLYRADLSVTGELTDDQVVDYYDFRVRLAFAALSARDFFTWRYCNSDSLQLVIRSYTPDSRGGVTVERRRRDGAHRILYSATTFLERKPDYVGSCDLGRDLDAGVLHSLERASTEGGASWRDIAEALRVFVRANSDNPAVDAQSELIDLVSAFSRLVNEWRGPETTRAFLNLAPPPTDPEKKDFTGPKVQHPQVQKSLKKGEPLRSIWLNDAFRLRHQYGHGRVVTPQIRPVWTLYEHLLFGAWIFPLAAKHLLSRLNVYQLSPDDRFRDRSFEHLLELEPFASVARRRLRHEADEEAEETWTAWEAKMSTLRMRFAGEEIMRRWAERDTHTESEGDNAEPGDEPSAQDAKS